MQIANGSSVNQQSASRSDRESPILMAAEKRPLQVQARVDQGKSMGRTVAPAAGAASRHISSIAAGTRVRVGLGGLGFLLSY
jgi:hypothetical protein